MFLKNVLLAFMLASGLVSTLPVQAEQRQVSYEQYLTELKQQAIEQGIKQSTLDDVFGQIKLFKKAVVELETAPAPKNLEEYLPQQVSEALVEQARDLYREHKSQFDKLGKSLGVQPRFVVAYWGIKSGLGLNGADYPAMTVIASNAYRAENETQNQQAFMAGLKLIERGDVAFEGLKSNAAGDMGYPGFTPQQLADYGKDGNKDGQNDIWHNPEDAFASTANYLKSLGWDDAGTWGRQVRVPTELPLDLVGLSTRKTFAQWQALGLRRFDGSALPSRKDMQVSLIMPDGMAGRKYLVYDNYRVLRQAELSDYVALSVAYLSERIKYPAVK